jgi:hypothetical protein
MSPDNKKFLDENLQHFLTLERAFYMRGLAGYIRDGMQRVMREEFRPGYTADLWCSTCVSKMVNDLYKHYHDWLRKEYNDTTVYKDITEGIIEMNKLPVIVHTGFPANK